MHEDRLTESADLNSEGQLEVSPELAEELRNNPPRPQPTLGNILRLPFRYIRDKIYRRQGESTSTLDEYGLPVEWRHEYDIFRAEHHAPWNAFQSWCVDNDEISIPASAETILKYLVALKPSNRHSAYYSIAHKHESLYWHTDGCSHCELHVWYKFSVHEDGRMTTGKPEIFYEHFGLADQISIA